MPDHSLLAAAALDYARAGWPVFPCLPKSKQPAIKGGFHAATTNPATIQRYWRIADRNIGIPTGEGAGFWVLDVDGEAGEATLAALVNEARPAAADAGSDHRQRAAHLVSIAPRHSRHQQAASASGSMLRADRAYIVAPPSIHPSGRVYSWRTPAAPLAPAPVWLVRLARAKPVPTITEQAVASIRTRTRTGPPGAYGLAALNAEVAALAAVAPGSRNHALNLASFRLFQLVAGGELDGGGSPTVWSMPASATA